MMWHVIQTYVRPDRELLPVEEVEAQDVEEGIALESSGLGRRHAVRIARGAGRIVLVLWQIGHLCFGFGGRAVEMWECNGRGFEEGCVGLAAGLGALDEGGGVEIGFAGCRVRGALGGHEAERV
jgi:hypothetical protein